MLCVIGVAFAILGSPIPSSSTEGHLQAWGGGSVLRSCQHENIKRNHRQMARKKNRTDTHTNNTCHMHKSRHLSLGRASGFQKASLLWLSLETDLSCL